MEPITRVRFYKEKEGILAVFPDEKEYTTAGVRSTCYAHLGQHSSSYRAYHYRLPKAVRAEYTSLLQELTSLGYRLKVLNPE
jgi:hypothetical protein